MNLFGVRPNPEARRCEVCGDWIRRPVPRAGNMIVCTECWGDYQDPQPYNKDKSANADKQYHGGTFNRGEW